MDNDTKVILFLIIGILIGVGGYLLIKRLIEESPSTVSIARDKEGRIIEFSTLPLPKK